MKSRIYIYCVRMMGGGSQSAPHAASGSRTSSQPSLLTVSNSVLLPFKAPGISADLTGLVWGSAGRLGWGRAETMSVLRARRDGNRACRRSRHSRYPGATQYALGTRNARSRSRGQTHDHLL